MTTAGVTKVVALLRSGELVSQYRGLVSARHHPDCPLALINYTPECQFHRFWDEVTRLCRGLIVNTATWEVAAWPFPKFFNVGERPETQPDALPLEPFLVLEKIDGSLGISYQGPRGPALATRGSFTSDQALRGTALLRQLPGFSFLEERWTFLFEIIYGENRSVIRYPFEGLVLLAVIDRRNGREAPWNEVESWAARLGCRLPRVYSFQTLAEVLASREALPPDLEGYVLRYASGFRVKLKGQAYLTLHKVLLGISLRRVAEALEDGTFEQWLAEVPEEFRLEVEEMAAQLNEQATSVEQEVRHLYAQVPPGVDRKTFALWVQTHCPMRLRHPLFLLHDGKAPNWHVMLRRFPHPHGEGQ